jgi:hypothetical protein
MGITNLRIFRFGKNERDIGSNSPVHAAICQSGGSDQHPQCLVAGDKDLAEETRLRG